MIMNQPLKQPAAESIAVDQPQWTERQKKAFQEIDLVGNGLEIGPLDKPLLPKSVYQVKYADHLDRIGLQRKYLANPFVDTSRIVDVDFVTHNAALSHVVGSERFDYILASHVIEHVPELIGFLVECTKVLSPGGVVSLIVPDKRYSFDVRRRLSTFSDLLAAWLEGRDRPSIRDLCDHYFEVVRVTPEDLWRHEPAGVPDKYHSYADAMSVAMAGLRDSRYIDCHVWVFTFDSFISVIGECRWRGLIDVEIVAAAAPVVGEMDFFCSLKSTRCC